MQYKAFLFDMNGTMIDDMDYHIRAWHQILNDLGAGISMETARANCYGKNAELLDRIFPGRFTETEKQAISIKKEMAYQRSFRPKLQLLAGLAAFLEKARQQGIKMAIGSAAIMLNIDFVLDGLEIRHYFDAIVSADDVLHSKPDPETFLACAQKLGIAPADCLVFEDAPQGIAAARQAGMDSLVLTTLHEPDEFNQAGIIGFEKDFTNLLQRFW